MHAKGTEGLVHEASPRRESPYFRLRGTIGSLCVVFVNAI